MAGSGDVVGLSTGPVTSGSKKSRWTSRFGLVHFLQVSVVSDVLDPILPRQNLVVTRHDGDNSEL
jgi:hypothetical protein